MIKAPFNFVPLNKEVFYPDWSEKVSHDIPFEDGESGEIDITITAKSPIFIANHSNRNDDSSKEFCNHNGQYYIPGSSVKGMIRSVLEIMSFSKLTDEQFTDTTYAVRDLSSAKNFYMKQMNQLENTTYCGWLKKESGKFIVEDCGIPGRIHHREIDKALNLSFSSKFKKSISPDMKSAKFKYGIIPSLKEQVNVRGPIKSKTNEKYDVREFYYHDSSNKNSGTLVCTGQPTSRKDSGKMGDGKGFEFLFFDNDTKSDLEISEKIYKDFLFAYFDGRTTEPRESVDWGFWKEKLNNGEKVPVFFQKQGTTVLHFGLSYLYKLPYKYSVKHGVKQNIENKIDLSQTIFGYNNKENKTSLKGRVNFSHFKANDSPNVLDSRTEILGTPRASYYPMYVKQPNADNYKTFMDKDFEIAGRKRYPIHTSSNPYHTSDTGNENVGTTFKPLEDGVIFNGKIRYHNLKRVELGALFSAITFHNTPKTFHSIGLAKPLGYGKINIQVNNQVNLETYLKDFELLMSENIDKWSDSNEIKELLTMSSEQKNTGDYTLGYMELPEFGKLKNHHESLKNYSKLDNVETKKIKTSLSTEDMNKKILLEIDKADIDTLISISKKHKHNNSIINEAFIKKLSLLSLDDNLLDLYRKYTPLRVLLLHKGKITDLKSFNNEYKSIKNNVKKFEGDHPNFNWSKDLDAQEIFNFALDTLKVDGAIIQENALLKKIAYTWSDVKLNDDLLVEIACGDYNNKWPLVEDFKKFLKQGIPTGCSNDGVEMALEELNEK